MRIPTIACIRNRFSNEKWPQVTWIDHKEEISCDYLVFMGPDVELLVHPSELIFFRQREYCGILIESDSIHVSRPDFPAPLGHAKFSDEFFVLKSGGYALKFLEKWHLTRDTTSTVWDLGVMHVQYPHDIVRFHVPEHSMPDIRWGFKETA